MRKKLKNILNDLLDYNFSNYKNQHYDLSKGHSISEDAEVIINEITPVNSTEKLEYLNLDDMYVKKEDGSFAPILHELEDDVLSAAAEQCGV